MDFKVTKEDKPLSKKQYISNTFTAIKGKINQGTNKIQQKIIDWKYKDVEDPKFQIIDNLELN